MSRFKLSHCRRRRSPRFRSPALADAISGPRRAAGDQLDRDRHVRRCSCCSRSASPTGRPSAPVPPRSSIRPAAASPASRTASPSPATTCRRPRSSAFPASSTCRAIDGLIYSVGWLVGWPIVTFLIAEPLRNLGKFTFADVASFRFQQTPIRILAACGTLVTVAFYLIAQMVGAGSLIQLLFGLPYMYAVIGVGVPDDHLCDLRRHGGDDLGADHQGLPAARRRDLHGLHGSGQVSASARKPCSPRRWKSIPSIWRSWSPAR